MHALLKPLADTLIDTEALARYFQSRQNPDGGFCFYGLDESSLSDTCYAVLCLQIIGRQPDNHNVAGYLREYQNDDGSFPNVYVTWFVLSALAALGESIDLGLSSYAVSLYEKHRIRETGSIETQSIFEPTFYLAEVLHKLGRKQECRALGEKIVPYIKMDGSIGTTDSGLASTYHGLAILMRAGIPCDAEKTTGWARKFAVAGGGFTKKPVTGLAFMDETYFGLQIFSLLGERPPYAKETIRFVAGCQNDNGGFRRALASGISGFETSYYALESLRALLNIKY